VAIRKSYVVCAVRELPIPGFNLQPAALYRRGGIHNFLQKASNGRRGRDRKSSGRATDRYGEMPRRTSYGLSFPPETVVEEFAVDTGTNRVTAWSSRQIVYPPPPQETFTYDAAGNLMGDGRSYDTENRLPGLTRTGFSTAADLIGSGR